MKNTGFEEWVIPAAWIGIGIVSIVAGYAVGCLINGVLSSDTQRILICVIAGLIVLLVVAQERFIEKMYNKYIGGSEN
jgi:uncharacterized membrane protein YoaK (UPF0700 family)